MLAAIRKQGVSGKAYRIMMNRRNAVRGIWAAVFTMLLWLPALAMADADYTTLSKADFIKTDALLPPPTSAQGWVRRTLPDNWNLTMPDMGGRGWYRLTWQVQEPDDLLWVVYQEIKGRAPVLIVMGVNVILWNWHSFC